MCRLAWWMAYHLQIIKSLAIDWPKEQGGPNAKPNMERRDIYQRKAYAVRRMSLAVMRVSQAISQAEKDKADCWVKIWGTVGGIRRFKLGNGGGKGRGGRR